MCMLLNYNLWVEQALNPDYQKNEAHRTENEWEVKRLIKNCNFTVIMNYRRVLNSINRDQREASAATTAPAKQVVAPEASPAPASVATQEKPTAKKSKAAVEASAVPA